MDFRTNFRVTPASGLAAPVSPASRFAGRFQRHSTILFLLFLCLLKTVGLNSVEAQTPEAATNNPALETNGVSHFSVSAFAVEDNSLLPTNVWVPILSKYTGTNISLEEIARAAADLQGEYRNHGYSNTSIAVAQEQITNGVVTFNVFQTAIPQIVVSGVQYSSPTNTGSALNLPAMIPASAPQASTPSTVTNVTPPPVPVPIILATPEQIAQAEAALYSEMTNLDTEEKDTRVHVVSTNAGPRFEVERYRIMGNTVLAPKDFAMILTNIDGAYGTNVSFDGIRTVVQQLQNAYRDRGYVTVAVTLPRQKLTNATVKVQVTEGWLASIDVKGNRYFSSNNVMRALPSLHTNILLNGNVLQAELNRANANQERQIYPVIGPGPDPGSSALTLNVKDQLPLHGKLDLNNESTPDTPPLRLNGSAVYDNLWQLEHQIGAQYSFSPEDYKEPNYPWDFYDKPLIANYSAFYRLPLGNPGSAQDEIASNPSFGYNEATRKFNMPPLTGSPSLTLLAGRSTIDTGWARTPSVPFSSSSTTNSFTTVDQSSLSQNVTVSSDIAARLSLPFQSSVSGFNSSFSGGFDLKDYKVNSLKTNVFTFTTVETGAGFLATNVSTDLSGVPYTVQQITYAPLSLRYDASWQDDSGVTTAGLGLSANLWYYSTYNTYNTSIPTNSLHLTGSKALQQITGSTESHGYWVILTPSFSRNFLINNWNTIFRTDGQWTSEPLISNEQYGIGGVSSVRGYHEGEAFGDCGWHLTLEEDTPPHVVGTVYGNQKLSIQGSIYTDAGAVYLLDPAPGQRESMGLWGTGVGLAASVGSHWQAQFLFSVPLISTSFTPKYQPLFNFNLTAQF